MTESFAELFEQSIASQRIRPGTILNGLIVEVGQDYVIVNVGLKSEAVIPSDQFKNEKGEIEVVVGETVEVALDSVEDGSGETRLSREKAKRARNVDASGNRVREAGNRHRHHHRPREGWLHRRDRQCPRVPSGIVWSTCVPCAIPLTSRTSRSNSRSSSSIRSATTSWYRGARWSNRNTAPNASALARQFAGRRRRQGRGQESHRLRRVRGFGRHRWFAAHHRHGLEARQASFRSGQGRRGNRRSHSQVRPRTSARLARPEAARRRPLAEHRAPLSGKHPPVRQGHQHRRLRLLRRNRRGRRRPGARVGNGLDQQERQSRQGGSRRPGSRSHGARHRRRTPPHQLGRQAVQGQSLGRTSPRTTIGATRSAGRSNRSPTSASSSALPAASTVLVHLSDISWDMPGEEAVRSYQKAQQVDAMVLSIDPERERISLGIKQLAKDPFSAYIAEHPKGSGRHRRGARSGCQGRDHRSRQRGRRAAAGVGTVARSGRGCASAVEGRSGSRGPVHRCGSQGPQHLAVRSRRRTSTRNRKRCRIIGPIHPTGTSLGDLLKEQISGQD